VEPGEKVDPGGRQVLVDEDRLSAWQLLEHVQRGEVVDVLVAGLAAVAGGEGLAVGLGAGAAEELGPVAQGLEVADAGQEQSHLGVGDDGAGDLAADVQLVTDAWVDDLDRRWCLRALSEWTMSLVTSGGGGRYGCHRGDRRTILRRL
jgi:hypothetical protein